MPTPAATPIQPGAAAHGSVLPQEQPSLSLPDPSVIPAGEFCYQVVPLRAAKS